mmetsp:Transcript_2784/g.5763  ORF Transcript_2784/g.5763 Transcript_2784/m.5763 type:complete len:230 (-) Transcript_2784:179-868(-)|eukprot:CAMPEP_0118932156 /NCGR_PEP_ID=MMETSP1169-20130426/9287_1 /TAXON_ID=36882 /ORGANISM="Pyramimonas obovata, Strain CCMP722" /LENGTH=229 /DNA_ID=CAMNT_0006874771 /DNA_START=56 /DNA_END=745 /DNA_ORIENTATION=+
MGKVLIITTSADMMGDHPTGAWLEEIAAPYNVFTGAGCQTDIASVKGGVIPIDAGSRGEGFYTEDCKTFEANEEAMKKFNESLALDSVDVCSYDAIFLSGGHGCCVDFESTPSVLMAIEKMYAAGKVVSAVCHGVLAFVNAKKPNGEPLVKDLKVCAFTDDEEKAVGLDGKVPFLVESKLRELGADFQKGADWASKVVRDGNLVSGQNPGSSLEAAKLALEACKKCTCM